MFRLIRELRHREVFRTGGLYIGICWILIEAASILLPTFDAPEWVLRGLIIVAVIGFPVALALGWIYDFSGKGVSRDVELTDTAVVAPIGRKTDFVVIAILAVALALSVYLNVTGGPELLEEIEPVSVLIADFENATGEPMFEGLLEQWLDIGIESAPHIASLERDIAENVAEQLQPGTDGLPLDAARLVAVREGVSLVLSGSVEVVESGYRLALQGLDPISGESSFDVSADAANRDEVLSAVGILAEAVRAELGEENFEQSEESSVGAITAASIEAASSYRDAVDLASEGRHEEAIEQFRAATEVDPEFGRAFSGWALSAFQLGRDVEAEELWSTALSLMDTMTERERLTTLGLYYLNVTQNYERALESFLELTDKYPADVAGRSNLAESALRTLDVQRAVAEGRNILDVFPNNRVYRANSARYAVYSGDFDAAASEARAIVEDDPEFGAAYLPLASALVAMGDIDGARESYQRMAQETTSLSSVSLARLGLADISIYSGAFRQARELLLEGIEQDIAADARLPAAVKYVALAETSIEQDDFPAAVVAANEAMALSGQDSVRVAAAIVLLEAGELETARGIANELSMKLQNHSRAYGAMIEGMFLRQSGDYVEAIDRLRAALDLADLWRIRYELGRAYLDAGFFAEAFDDLATCLERRGEATAMFFDSVPTFRYASDLSYWIGRAQDGLGIRTAAVRNYENYLTLRPQGGRLVDDARQRLQ